MVPCQGGADSGHGGNEGHQAGASSDALAMAIPDKISKSFYDQKIVQF